MTNITEKTAPNVSVGADNLLEQARANKGKRRDERSR